MSTPAQLLTLPNLAAHILRDALGLPGWANSPRDLLGALPLLENLDGVVPALPAELATCQTQSQAMRAAPGWCRAELSIETEPRQLDAARKCVRCLIEKGSLPAGSATGALLAALGINE